VHEADGSESPQDIANAMYSHVQSLQCVIECVHYARAMISEIIEIKPHKKLYYTKKKRKNQNKKILIYLK
jgi:hypothetical protein